jgi:hypothetical protein
MFNKKIILAGFYFLISTAITWWFIEASPLYTSMQQKLLSCGIAGAKWSLQIFAALLFVKENKWQFLKNIGLTCFVGSLILLPYAILSFGFGINNNNFFIGSLLLAVAVMILMYAFSVKNASLKIYWWLAWLGCLAIAITLQLTIVFNVL